MEPHEGVVSLQMVNKISRSIIGFDQWHLELVRNHLIHYFLKKRKLSIEVIKVILVEISHVDFSKFSPSSQTFFSICCLAKQSKRGVN